MNPTIKKSWELGQGLGMNQTTIAKHIGVARPAYGYWLRGMRNPSQNSLKKVQRFIDRVEAGETFKPKPKPKPKNVPIDQLEERVRVMYGYIYKLENKYGSLSDADDDDPILKLLRKEVGV